MCQSRNALRSGGGVGRGRGAVLGLASRLSTLPQARAASLGPVSLGPSRAPSQSSCCDVRQHSTLRS